MSDGIPMALGAMMKKVQSDPLYMETYLNRMALEHHNEMLDKIYQDLTGKSTEGMSEEEKEQSGITMLFGAPQELLDDPQLLLKEVTALFDRKPKGHLVMETWVLHDIVSGYATAVKALLEQANTLPPNENLIPAPREPCPLDLSPYEVDNLQAADYMSSTLARVIKWLDNMTSLHKIADEAVGRLDMRNSDLIHEIELTHNPEDDWLLKAVKQQRANRQDRRHAKDTVWMTSPLVDALNKPEVKKAVDRLREALGHIRKNEERASVQTYTQKQPGDDEEPLPHLEILFGLTNKSGNTLL